MKRTAAIVAILAGALLLFTGATASAGVGQGPCQHATSNTACKDDPSTHGKDCDKHGKNGGENQDHCVTGGGDNGGSTSVQGKIIHAPTTVKGGSLAKTGSAETTSVLGIGLILIGLGVLPRTFGRKQTVSA